MKKNLFTIIILALLVVNIVLTGIMAFTIIPTSKKTGELITQICGAIDLELESGNNYAKPSVPMSQIETYNIKESMTINLKKGSDNKDHFAVISPSINQDTKNEDYKQYGGEENMLAKESPIKDEIRRAVSGYTYEEIQQREIQDKLLTEIRDRLCALYDSDFIVSVSFGSAVYQ